MANKKSKLEPAVRIRENQRRARQRQRELLEELKARVAVYETQGVQATLELQRSARRVARENAALRLLLRAKGVEDAEVHGFVAAECQDTGPGNAATDTIGTENGLGEVSAVIYGCTSRHRDVDHCARSTRRHDATKEQNHCSVSVNSSEVRFQPEKMGQHARAQLAPDMVPGDDKQFATSCVEAAELLVSIRGHDREQVMMRLGCNGRPNCSVKNTELLEIMDS